MTTALTLEGYKRNFSTMENSLTTDNSDPRNELKNFATYLDYVESGVSPNCPLDKYNYFFSDALPKIVRIILRRKYANNEEHISSARDLLIRLAGWLPRFLSNSCEGVFTTLGELLDSSQPFYIKHGFTNKVQSKDTEKGISPELLDLVNRLELEDYIDVKTTQGVWDYAKVTQISVTKTEIEVCYATDNKIEWLSLETNGHRIAEFSTKYGQPDVVAVAVVAEVVNDENKPPESSASVMVEDIIEDPEELDWRLHLSVGDLVDAQDATGQWLQACILDICERSPAIVSTVEVSEVAGATGCEALPPVPVSPLTGSSGDDEIEDDDSAVIGAVAASTAACAAAEVSSSCENCQLPMEVDVEQHSGVLTEQTGQVTEPISTTTTPLPPIFEARISFIGMPEKCDCWIGVTNKKIQKLNSKSGAKRGENPVREEVLHIVKHLESPRDHEDPTVLRDSCFVSLYYHQVVFSFANNGGFNKVLTSVRNMDSEASPWSVAQLLTTVIGIGHTHSVLSQRTLHQFAQQFVNVSIYRLVNMDIAAIRETPIEVVEAALKALENLARARYGRTNELGQLIETAWLEAALVRMRCPFLNRRLGGLKLLAELIRRGQNTIQAPTGILFASTVAADKSTYRSYRVLSVLYHETLASICARLRQECVMELIFKGPLAHESLMTRAGEVLRAMVQVGELGNDNLSIIWESGHTLNQPAALQVLDEIIRNMDYDSLNYLMQQHVLLAESANVNTGLVDIVASIGSRSRHLLFNFVNNFKATCTSISVESSPARHDKYLKKRHELMELHKHCIATLWQWSCDGSAVSDVVVPRCLAKLESILTITTIEFNGDMPSLPSDRNKAFPWAVHWERTFQLISSAIEALATGKSIFPALAVLQACISSWPNKYVAAISAQSGVPLAIAARSAMVRYVEDNFHIFALLSNLLSSMKVSVHDFVASLRDPMSDPAAVLSSELQMVVNEHVVGSSRTGYKTLIEKLLDFVHMFCRCNVQIYVPRSLIEAVWSSLVAQAVTVAEADAGVDFIGRMILQTGKNSNNNKKIMENNVASEAEDVIRSSNIVRRTTICSIADMKWAFATLFCSKQFISSPFYSMMSFVTTEKLFRWVNAEDGRIIETKDKAIPGTLMSTTVFTIVSAPSTLSNLSAFSYIIVAAVSEPVARAAVKFLTTLPQKLSADLISSNQVAALRKQLVLNCMTDLDELRASKLNCADNIENYDRTLQRLLMLLDGILEESAVDGRGLLRPHDFLSKGPQVVFTLGSSKNISGVAGIKIVMFASDTMKDLMDAVEAAIKRPLSDFKVLHRTKEVNVQDGKKLISQLGTINEYESLNLFPRITPATAASQPEQKTYAAAVFEAPESNSLSASSEIATVAEPSLAPTLLPVAKGDKKSPRIRVSELPAAILTNNAECISLLFHLLETSTGAVCDSLWSLLTRLPTSPAALQTWLMLGDNANTVLWSNCTGSDGQVSLPRLLYNLQIIEMLIQPADSIEQFVQKRQLFADLDENLLELWPEKFIYNQGFFALEKAMQCIGTTLSIETLEDQVKASLSPRNDKCIGVTPRLLLRAMQLVGKLTRSFMIHHVSKMDYPQAEAILSSVERVRMEEKGLSSKNAGTSDKDSSTTNSTSQTQTYGPALPPHLAKQGEQLLPPPPPPTSKGEVGDTISAVSSEQTAIGNNQYSSLSKEWGWRLAACSQMMSCSNEDCSLLQQVSLSIMGSLRRFTKYDMFSLDPECCMMSDRLTVQRVHDGVMAVMYDLFVIWRSVFILYPEVLLNIHSSCSAVQGAPDNNVVTAKIFLGQLFVGMDFLTANHSSSEVFTLVYGSKKHSNLDIGNRIGLWALSIIKSFFELAAYESLVSVVEQFKRSLFVALLEIRPVLLVSCAAELAPAGNYEPLFSLASLILLGKNNDSQFALTCESCCLKIPSDDCLNMAVKIFADLQWASQLVNDVSNRCHKLQCVDGTLKLLAALLRQSDNFSVLSELSSQGLMDFLIIKCLGLVARHEAAVVPLCNLARSSAYEIIEIFAKWSTKEALYACEKLMPVHASVPAPTGWSHQPDQEKRSLTGYVGLRNFGCTCYMNSLLQVLYMLPEVRQGVIDTPMQLHASEEHKKNDYYFQLQNLFLNLQHSELKAFSADDWVFSYKDESGQKPVNVCQQQDAQEFLQVLSDRLEIAHKYIMSNTCNDVGSDSCASSATASVASRDPLQRAFGGKLCNQMLKELSPNAVREAGDVREHDESFVCISIDVKGSKGLEDSLSKFVLGETISDYTWDDAKNAPRVNIVKRQCISEISDTIIFHLKRFELNFDTFMREKVNDSFPFPMQVNMLPYTKEGLMQQGVKDLSYYLFELKAIVVHTGTTDSGHYYSYIRQRSTAHGSNSNDNENTDKWCEFNDSDVRDFNADLRLTMDCFGGFSRTLDVIGSMSIVNEIPNPRSAYMLVYQRVLKAVQPVTDNISCVNESSQMETESQDAASCVETVPESQQQPVSVSVESDFSISQRNQIIRSIHENNTIHQLRSRVFAKSHVEFLLSLTELMRKHRMQSCNIFDSIHEYYPKHLVELTAVTCRLVTHSAHLVEIRKLLDLLTEEWTNYLACPCPSVCISDMTTDEDVDDLYGGDDESKAIAMSLASNAVDQSLRAEQITFASRQACENMLQFFNINFDSITGPVQFAADKDVRMKFVVLVGRIFELVSKGEELADWAQENKLIYGLHVLSSTHMTMLAAANTPMGFSESKMDCVTESDELALAIRLSQAEESKSCGVVSPSAAVSELTQSSVMTKFLYHLTTDSQIHLISENWRRSDAAAHLILLVARLHWAVRHVLVHREMIAQCGDIFLADQSPFIGVLYEKSARKRAVSSYVSIYPVKADGELIASAKNIPDWSDLLELMSLLVCTCLPESMSQPQAQAQSISQWISRPSLLPKTMLLGNSITPAPVMNEWDSKCVSNKTFLSIMLKQSRYIKQFCRIIQHASYDSTSFTSMVSEVLCEAVTMAGVESVAHIFEAIEAFMAVDDTLVANRKHSLFNPGAQSGLFEILFTIREEPIRARFVCVCLRSIFVLVQKFHQVREFLSYSTPRVQQWAPWVLKFLFQFITRCTKENESAAIADLVNRTASPDAPQSPLLLKGPFVLVFGETPEERESTWLARANATLDLLQRVLSAMGANVDQLVPEDTFNEPVAAATTAATASSTAMVTEGATHDMATGMDISNLRDGMTDEEINQFFLSQTELD